MKPPEIRLGRWAAFLSAAFAILWFITFQLQDVFQPMPTWHNLEAYAEDFRMVRLSYVYPSLLLAISYIILLACLHRIVPDEKKIWSLIALSMFFAGFLFQAGKLEKWIRGLLLIQLITAFGQTGYSMFDMHEGLFIATSMIWVLGALAAFILIGIWLHKQRSVSSLRT